MIVSAILSAALSMAPPPTGGYLVLVEPGKDDAFLPAANAMAALHEGAVVKLGT